MTTEKKKKNNKKLSTIHPVLPNASRPKPSRAEFKNNPPYFNANVNANADHPGRVRLSPTLFCCAPRLQIKKSCSVFSECARWVSFGIIKLTRTGR
jgi:hypothetical protein